MPFFTIEQAEAELEELVARAEDGEDIVITPDGEAVARLEPLRQGGSHASRSQGG